MLQCHSDDMGATGALSVVGSGGRRRAVFDEGRLTCSARILSGRPRNRRSAGSDDTGVWSRAERPEAIIVGGCGEVGGGYARAISGAIATCIAVER